MSIKDFNIRSCSSSIAIRDRVRLEEEERWVDFEIITFIYDNCLAAVDNDAATTGEDFAPSPSLGVFERIGS